MFITDKNLIIKAKNGDRQALEEIINSNTGLVWSIVKRFSGRGYEVEDLYQIGCIGFIKAIQRFDTTLDYKISTFAVPYILGEIKRFLRDDGMIKVSRSIKGLSFKIKEIENDYLSKTGTSITINKLSELLDVTEEEIYLAMDSAKQVESINDEAFMDSGKEKIETIIVDENIQDKIVDKITLKQLIEKLNFREKEIINLRYFKDKTQMQVAKILGISQVQVSRIEKKILNNMKEGFVGL
ncbi:MAG: sigma-70 family RNA polymerase sigma factor [Candidatus Scatovivens sp.]